MNKIKYTIIAIIFFCISSVSCTKEDTPQQNIKIKTEIAAFADLQKQLTDYNKSFGISETRGFWSFIKAIYTVAADVIGGIKGYGNKKSISGAITGAVGASAAAYGGWEVAIPFSGTSIGKPIKGYDCLDCVDRIDSLGIIHNEILIELYQEDSTLFVLGNGPALFLAIKLKSEEHYPDIDFTDVDATFIQEIADSVNTAIFESDNMSIAISRLKNSNPEISAELDIIEILFYGIAEIEDDEAFFNYIDGFKNIVMDSDIPEESKEVIRIGLAIVLGSKQLWQN